MADARINRMTEVSITAGRGRSPPRQSSFNLSLAAIADVKFDGKEYLSTIRE